MTSRVTKVGSDGLLNGPQRPVSGRFKGGSMTRHNDSRSDGQKRRRKLAMGVGGTGRSKRIRGTTILALGQSREDHPAQLPTHQVIEGQGGSWGSQQSRKTFKLLLP